MSHEGCLKYFHLTVHQITGGSLIHRPCHTSHTAQEKMKLNEPEMPEFRACSGIEKSEPMIALEAEVHHWQELPQA